MYEYLFKDTDQKFSYETNRRLREHRRRIGFSLPYVAETLGVSETQLKNYESGTKQIPPAILSKLGTLYNVSPGYFLGDVDIQPKVISSSKYHKLF